MSQDIQGITSAGGSFTACVLSVFTWIMKFASEPSGGLEAVKTWLCILGSIAAIIVSIQTYRRNRRRKK